MKQNNSRFDKKIVVFYAIVIFIAGITYVYKYKNTRECPEIAITISEPVIDVGKLIQFSNRTLKTTSISWDFGDTSLLVNEQNPTHMYRYPGEYFLRVTINNRCQEVRKIMVTPRKIIVNETLIPQFTCPEYVSVGKPVKFVCLTKNSKTIEWRFGETGKIDSRITNPVYSYTTAGPKTVSLILNNNSGYIAKKIIYAISPEVPKVKATPAPPPSSPKPQVAPKPQPTDEFDSYDKVKTAPVKEHVKENEKLLTDEELKTELIGYSKGQKTITANFSSFCEKPESVPVVANDKPTNLSVFLEKIKGHPMTIKNIRVLREKGKCINQIIINYKTN